MGYFVGNISLRKKVGDEYSKLAGRDLVKKSVLDEVGLGIVVYDKNGTVYVNKTLFNMSGFTSKHGVPKTLDTFLDLYDDGDNKLKSTYILGCENGINVIRANYFSDKKIYEIKIIRNAFAAEEYEMFTGHDLKIVIVDDITQIKDDERRQKDLAANVSHELKTPLTVIKMSNYFFENITPDHMPSYDALKRWGGRISANADRMEDIVRDFLVLSEASQTNKMGIFDIRDCTAEAMGAVSEYPGADRVKIVPPANETYPLLYGNQSLVMRVIINMLTNAIKYIDYDGKKVANEIRIIITTIGDQVSVQVEDNGRGIPEESLGHLFERFYRVDNSGSREVGGSGIGLSIAREIAEMHGGSISVTSAVRTGSTFNLNIPTAHNIFESVHKDALSGVVSDMPIYKSAAANLCLQICEAVRSYEYEDLYGKVEAYEKCSAEDKQKTTVNLLRSFDTGRFENLLEELLFVDDDFFDGEEYFAEPGAEVPQPAVAEAVPAAPTEEEIAVKEAEEAARAAAEEEAARAAEEERIRREKEEARKLLTQPVTQLSAASAKNDTEMKKEKATVHPSAPRKRYNKTAESESSLKKLMDDSNPLSE